MPGKSKKSPIPSSSTKEISGHRLQQLRPTLDPAYHVSDKEWHVLFRLEPIKSEEV